MVLTIESKHPGFTRIVGDTPTLEHMATGFSFTEGPVWRDDHLLFTDIPKSRIVKYRIAEEGPEITTYRYPSGHANGMTLDLEGRLITCEHSNRRVTRTEANGNLTILADRYEGKRLNSPNDVVVASDSSVYFTDPPYGLGSQMRGKELDFQGVFRVSPEGDSLTLLLNEMQRPNGLAFSPDEKVLYIADSAKKQIMAFKVTPYGALTRGHTFAKLETEEQGVPDGLKVDIEGNLYSTGPGGVWVFNADGILLGRILTTQLPANCAWGDTDRQSLYLTCRSDLYRVKLQIPGTRAW